MEAKRLTERNKIHQDIKQLESYITSDEATIDRLRRQRINEEYNKQKIGKLGEKNVEREEEVIKLKEKLGKINSGQLDNEINKQYIKNEKPVVIKEDPTKKTVEEKNQKQPQRFIQQNQQYNRTFPQPQRFNQQNQQNQHNNRTCPQPQRFQYRQASLPQPEIDHDYKNFTQACDSIPDYMRVKLKAMPNNKGYIWRGVSCYGESPPEKGEPTVLFEKQRDGLLLIHEWTAKEYKIWHKQGQDRKTLHSATQRRIRHLDK